MNMRVLFTVLVEVDACAYLFTYIAFELLGVAAHRSTIFRGFIFLGSTAKHKRNGLENVLDWRRQMAKQQYPDGIIGRRIFTVSNLVIIYLY